jgi:hypothetical protein
MNEARIELTVANGKPAIRFLTTVRREEFELYLNLDDYMLKRIMRHVKETTGGLPEGV